MVVTPRTISIPIDDAGIELIEAMQDFTAARSTKKLVRLCKDRGVRYSMRVPLVMGWMVDSRALGRGLRSLMRETVKGAERGDDVVIDFVKPDDSNLVLSATPWTAPDDIKRMFIE